MFKLKTNNIENFPFQEFAQELEADELEALAKEFNITAFNSWMLPQILAHYGSWKLIYKDGKVDPNLTAKANISTPWHVGLWKVCTRLKRGSLVKSQSDPEFASYSALVPLILAGAKRYQGIKYTQWNVDHSCRLISQDLLDALFWVPPTPKIVAQDQTILECGKPYYGLGSEELLELREQGLTIRSGKREGQVQKATSTWRLNGLGGTVLQGAPALVTTMLAQIWCAHPSLRTQYMILDPNDWDAMPEPLIAETVFVEPLKPAKVKAEKAYYDLPWN